MFQQNNLNSINNNSTQNTINNSEQVINSQQFIKPKKRA